MMNEKIIHKATWTAILLISLVILVTGCSSPKSGFSFEPKETIVWPTLPQQPRIQYLTELKGEQDLSSRSDEGLFGRIGSFLFGQKEPVSLINPHAIAINPQGTIYISDTSQGLVHIFDIKKQRYDQFSQTDGDTALSMPVGIAIVDSNVYVADSKRAKIFVFSDNGKFKFAFGTDHLERPAGLCYLGQQGKIFVADSAKHAIFVFGKDGTFIEQFGSRGLDSGQFNFPTKLCVDTAGNVYVSDTLNYRVQVFTHHGRFVGMFGQQGDRPGSFAHPTGIACDVQGRVYVVDRQFENIQVFNPQHQLLIALGGEGRQPGNFWLPAEVAVDADNRIYVVDSYNKRVQIFQLLEDIQ